ncbi:MAG: hypothetical protein LC803_16810 [Acidobacteria bacterium]|nr:hypothetical protein [Acidobacteriota bacterium]
MEQLEHPSQAVWDKRRDCFDKYMNPQDAGSVAYMLDEQACALTADLQAMFCDGAWVGVIVLAAAIVEAQLRLEVGGSRLSAHQLINLGAQGDAELHWLRQSRNRLIHANPDKPELTVDDQWSKRDKLEADANKAVKLVSQVFFMSPWI